MTALRMPDGVTIRALAGDAELRAAVALQREVWGEAFEEIVPRALLWVAQRIGGVAAGAFDDEDGTLIGLVFGLTGLRDGEAVHWSDLLAVRGTARGRGISVALKAHQRAQLLRIGVERVGWTFDPLESRNAHINFAKLGIVAREYLRDLYGPSSSPLHDAVGTDRLVADWRIGGERVARRLDGRERAPSAAEVAALPRINTAKRVGDGIESTPPVLDRDGARLRLAIPADIQSVKRASPELGRQWREHTRAAFEAYLGRGYRVEELVRVGETSDYVLAR